MPVGKPLSAIAARRLRQQQQKEKENTSTPSVAESSSQQQKQQQQQQQQQQQKNDHTNAESNVAPFEDVDLETVEIPSSSSSDSDNSETENDYSRKKQKLSQPDIMVMDDTGILNPEQQNINDDEGNILDWKCVSQFLLSPGKNAHKVDQDIVYDLYPGESLIIWGTYEMNLTSKGSVEIYGYKLKTPGKLIRVLALSSHALPIIECNDTPTSIRITDVTNTTKDIDRILKLSNFGIPTPLTPDTLNSGSSPTLDSGKTWKLLTRLESGLVSLQIDPFWRELVINGNSNQMDEQQPFYHSQIVLGPKRVGKSTLSKYLVNKILSMTGKAAYIDIDVGQNECFPAGTLGLAITSNPLLGPPGTHHFDDQVVCHFGSTTARDNPERYLNLVRHVLHQYKLKYSHVPLVINTPGWIKGLGLELMSDLFRTESFDQYLLITPDVSDVSLSHDMGDLYELLAPYNETRKVTSLLGVSQAPLERFWTPLNYREFFLMLQFYSIDDVDGDLTSLVRQAPYEVSWKHSSILKEVFLGGNDVPYSHVLHSLNGALVSIMEGNSQARDMTASFPYKKGQSPPCDAKWYGLGLVRGIDPEKQLLHVLLSKSKSIVSLHLSAISLAKLDIITPTALMIDFNSNDQNGICSIPWVNVPFLTTDLRESQLGSRRRVRRNVMRRGQRR